MCGGVQYYSRCHIFSLIWFSGITAQNKSTLEQISRKETRQIVTETSKNFKKKRVTTQRIDLRALAVNKKNQFQAVNKQNKIIF